jgi:hypothetical protein
VVVIRRRGRAEKLPRAKKFIRYKTVSEKEKTRPRIRGKYQEFFWGVYLTTKNLKISSIIWG